MRQMNKKSDFKPGDTLMKVVLPGSIILVLIFIFWGSEKPDIPNPVPLKSDWYRVETARGEILENTVLPGHCFICHSVQIPDQTVVQPAFAHATVKLEHGVNNRCYNCHHIYDRDKLAGDGESKIHFSNPEQLCARCHGIIYRDWSAGTHGLRQGKWLLAIGESAKNFTCTECHDPHAPKFNYAVVAPPPVWPEKTIRHTREGKKEDPTAEYLTEMNKERF